MNAWVPAIIQELVTLKGTEPGWSYHPGTEPFVEPTAIACLALLAAPDPAPGKSAVAQASQWLASLQQIDGSVGLCRSLPQPTWPTALAMLVWSAAGETAGRKAGSNHLLNFQAANWKKQPGDPTAHDTEIPGWSWVAGTHPWVETTSLALLALEREGLKNEARVKEGYRLLQNRALPTGGWNFGNTVLFGSVLRPVPESTALALLALAAGGSPGPAVTRGLEYLAGELPRVRSPESLCWGLLAMAAWSRRPALADTWLDETHRRLRPDGHRAMQLAHLLLAASDRGLATLGIQPRTDG